MFLVKSAASFYILTFLGYYISGNMICIVSIVTTPFASLPISADSGTSFFFPRVAMIITIMHPGLPPANLVTNELLHRYFSRTLSRFQEQHFKPSCSSHPRSNFEGPPMFSTPVGNPDVDGINAYSQCNHASYL